jgi:hypothetical protein
MTRAVPAADPDPPYITTIESARSGDSRSSYRQLDDWTPHQEAS